MSFRNAVENELRDFFHAFSGALVAALALSVLSWVGAHLAMAVHVLGTFAGAIIGVKAMR